MAYENLSIHIDRVLIKAMHILLHRKCHGNNSLCAQCISLMIKLCALSFQEKFPPNLVNMRFSRDMSNYSAEAISTNVLPRGSELSAETQEASTPHYFSLGGG